jgi:phenylpyruvate tautomerase PptA (4-oxalocrotonate tautomerase family)
MPIIECKNRAGLSLETKAQLADEITAVVRDVIQSPMDLISVTFADLPAESTYRSGLPTSDTLIFCHIRKGPAKFTMRNGVRLPEPPIV